MKLPNDVTEILKRKFKNNHREWLKAVVSEKGIADSFPLEINLNIPTEQNALKQPDGVRSWISAWKAWQDSEKGKLTASKNAGCDIIWIERRWLSLGTQSVPKKIILKTPEDAASWIDESKRWSRAVDRFKLMVQRWSSLIDVLPKHFDVLADYNDSDFKNLCEILSWLQANPNSNFYIRQIPLAGIDSKWLEKRKRPVVELLTAILNLTVNADDSEIDNTFFELCGLKRSPKLYRMRILDPELRKYFGGLGDISVPLEEIANLNTPFAQNENISTTPHVTVFIIENVQTALAFDDLRNSIVIMGLGYDVEILGKIPWLRNSRCVYWGDIDTHGFAILNRARSYLPNMESVLMDKATFLSHKELWGEEPDQNRSAELPLLTDNEKEIFKSLKNNIFGQQVRLEQERIRWDVAWDVLLKYTYHI